MLKLFVLLSFIAAAYSDCTLRFNVENQPTFIKSFGTRKVLLPKNENNGFRIKYNEVIEAYCTNGFWYGCKRRIERSKIQVKCQNNNMYYSTDGNGFNDYISYDCSNYLRCSDASGYKLYESRRPLKNCSPHMSLGVGLQLDNFKPIVFAGVCYDWSMMDLKYVNYMAYRSKSGFLTDESSVNTLQINSVSLDEELDDIQDFYNFLSYNNSILTQFNFENGTLIQDMPLRDNLKSLENILQIVWWRNLRLANWRTFLNLLEERSRDVSYDIYTGTSGVITMPALDSDCAVNKTLSFISSDKQSRAVPAYIWSYLKSTQSNVTEEFVVVGYNSPFYYTDSSIYLCEDICDKIEWLHTFHKLRKMATLGLIYCCRPEDVAHKLNNFPYSLLEKVEVKADTEMLKTEWILHRNLERPLILPPYNYVPDETDDDTYVESDDN